MVYSDVMEREENKRACEPATVSLARTALVRVKRASESEARGIK